MMGTFWATSTSQTNMKKRKCLEFDRACIQYLVLPDSWFILLAIRLDLCILLLKHIFNMLLCHMIQSTARFFSGQGNRRRGLRRHSRYWQAPRWNQPFGTLKKNRWRTSLFHACLEGYFRWDTWNAYYTKLTTIECIVLIRRHRWPTQKLRFFLEATSV
jgi:hypothetical protein